ncbi:MAG: phosphoethanolamine--lipid A transferase [Polaromonas sp.]
MSLNWLNGLRPGASLQGRHPWLVSAVLALALSTLGNAPFWWALARLPEVDSLRAYAGLIGIWAALTMLMWVFVNMVVWPWWRKPAGVLLLVMSMTASYFMAMYGVVIDPTMLANATQTNPAEVRDLLSLTLLLTLVLGVGVPGLWWWRWQPGVCIGWQRWSHQLGAVVVGSVLSGVLLLLVFQDLASLMRNHTTLRYMVNPFNTVYAVGRLAQSEQAQRQQPLQAIGDDASARPLGDKAAPPLLLLVVGETARAANFGIAGYPRPTTPQLQALQAQDDLYYFSQVQSCGTNTQVSLPCMFSHLDRQAKADSTASYESLLDVLQKAGWAVLWLENQTGCKGVCDRVPHVDTSELKEPKFCAAGECWDEIMLDRLSDRIAILDPVRRARGTVVVMHQMGSHGPAYYKRSPPGRKAFLPECTSNALPSCDAQALRNAYDNSIAYTDYFLGQAVSWLKTQQQPTALWYVSDHGESLGENGIYLHGMPYKMAPKEQTHVPMALWVSPAMRQHWAVDDACLRSQQAKPWSHDNWFHTVLGSADVKTGLYQPALDITRACRH